MAPEYRLINAATAWGAVGDGSTDNYPILQSYASALGPNAKVYFPPGRYQFSRPLEFGSNDLWVCGDGNATHLSIYENAYYFPAMNVGVRTAEGVTPLSVTAAYRPELFGVMDANYAPAPGGRYGFRSNGNAVCKAYAGPATIGALSAWSTARGGRLFDYWGEATGLTVRFCLFVSPGSYAAMRADGNGAVILGLGDVANPGPWCVGTDSSSPMNFFFCFKTNDQTLDSGTAMRYFRVAAPASGGRAAPGGVIHDVEFYVNFIDGTYGCRVDHASAAVVNASNMTGLAGKRLQRNRGYPFVVGPTQNPYVFNFSWGPVPDFGVYAMNVMRASSPDASGNDLMYKASADTVVSMDVDTPASLRLDRNILLKCGGCVPFNGTAMRLFHTSIPDLGFVTNAVVSDMKITGGLGLGTLNHARIHRVDVNDGVVGLEHLNLGTAYTFDVDSCRLGGYDTALDFCQVIATIRATNVQGMGDVAMRFRACTVTAAGVFVAGFSDGGRAVFDMIAGETNGIYTYSGIQLDEEGYTFTDQYGDGGAVFKIDLHPSSPNTVLEINGCQQDSSGSAAAFILLRGRAGTSMGGTVTAGGLQLGPNNGYLLKVVGPGWRGQVDRRGLRVQAVTGATADLANIKFTGEAVASGGGTSGPPATWSY